MMDGRRTLAFANLTEVMPEVDRLLAGHRTVGQWSLGQICNHLSTGIIGSVDGFPVRLPWVVRKLIGPLIVRRILKEGRMREGVKLPEKFVPRPGLDARAEAETLRAAIRLFGTHTGPHADHPLTGPLPHETWERLHCIHCAHHLGFASPETGGVG
jgi:Protein of unknown function (DUF1569)